MIVSRLQPDSQPIVSDRLHQRLHALDIAVVQAMPDGSIQPAGPCTWIENLILDSSLFRAALSNHWRSLGEQVGDVVTLWPGLWVAPLPSRHRRRSTRERFDSAVLMALFMDCAWLKTGPFHAICDAAKVDHRAVLDRVKPHQCVSFNQAKRMAAMLTWMQEDVTEIDRRLAELKGLGSELSESYEELSLLYKLSSNMMVNEEPKRFLENAVRELHLVSGLSWMALRLIDNDPRLKELGQKVFTDGSETQETRLHTIGGELIQRMPSDGQPLIIDDVATLNMACLDGVAKSILAVPIRFENQILGVLFGADKIDGSHINSVDAKLCHSLAGNLSIFLANTMLYDDMQSMFLGTLHALTNAIDAKDSYTHGHSERVALMSRMLAEKAGLPPQDVERIYISGLVHDVGKIGVPEAVLCKSGKLTREEFELIKMHPEIGARILEDIRQMQDLLPGVLHHHERWDGRGYPHQLAGHDIPLMGRVIGLADAFDAMSSNRTYRQALQLDEVLEEVKRCAGQQFDPDLAQVFLSLDFEPFHTLIEKHQAQSDPRSQVHAQGKIHENQP